MEPSDGFKVKLPSQKVQEKSYENYSTCSKSLILGKQIVENWKFAAPNSCSNLPSKPPTSTFKLEAGKSAKPIRNKDDEITGPEQTAALLIGRRQACLQTLSPGFEKVTR